MEPHMQYARTSDGVSIAYAVIGTGPPLVFAATIWGSLYMAQAGIDTLGYWSIDDLGETGRTTVLYELEARGHQTAVSPTIRLKRAYGISRLSRVLSAFSASR